MKKQYRKMKLWLCLLVSAVFVGVMLYVVLSAVRRENKKLLSDIENSVDFGAYFYISGNEIDWDKVLKGENVDRQKMLLCMSAFFTSLKNQENSLDSLTGQTINAVTYQAVVDKDGKVYHFPECFLEIMAVKPSIIFGDGEGETARLVEKTEAGDDAYPEFKTYPYCYYVPLPDDVVRQIVKDFLEGKIRYFYDGRVTGVREGNIVFAQTLEFPTKDGSGTIRYDVTYDFPEAPKDGIPFVYDNTGKEANALAPVMRSGVVGYLDDSDKQALCEFYGTISLVRPGNGKTQEEADHDTAENSKKYKADSEKAIADLLEMFDINSREWTMEQKGTYWDPGLFTTRWYAASSNGYETNGLMPNYVRVYEIKPLQMALGETKTSLIALCAIWAVVLGIVLLLVYLLQKRHEKYEKSRVALTRAAAHELKTPLAVLKTYAENWNDLGESERATCTKDMQTRIDYVNGLVGNILELSRLESDAKEMHPETIALPELNSVVLSQLEAITEGKDISVNAPKNVTDATVNGDLSMLRTVLTNFVTNAAHYGKQKIAIDITKKKDSVRYQITNDGDPIPADKLPHIWDAFYSADESRVKSGKNCTGTGLGLAITKQILELHKAAYGCESNAGGTTFWFEM